MNLEKATLSDSSAARFEMAILPWGALEPHNQHLPYYTDCLLSQAIALDAVSVSGLNVGVLPPVWLGQQNPSQTDYAFCVHTSLETQKAILGDVVRSLQRQGIDKLLIINGHGGNSFKGMVRDMAFLYPDFMILATDWYAIVPSEGYFENGGEHADEVETSVMMHYHPELVDLTKAGRGAEHKFALPSLASKTAWLPRRWKSVTQDTGIGDPSLSTADKGARYSAAVVARIADLIKELHQTTELYTKC
ncbi:MAG: creatininase family protein [Mucinivorans sp.]